MLEDSLVFVPGLGLKADETWYHPATGKTWIHDVEFLSQLGAPVRVFTFAYNSDVAANLSAACIAFHADDLLCFLSQALDDVHVGSPSLAVCKNVADPSHRADLSSFLPILGVV